MTGINPLGIMNMSQLFSSIGMDYSFNVQSSPLFSFNTKMCDTFPGGLYDTGNQFADMWKDFMNAFWGSTADSSEPLIETQKEDKPVLNIKVDKPEVEEPLGDYSFDVAQVKNKWAKSKPHLTDEFYQRVVEISQKINCDPNELMALMNAESGIKADEVNPIGGATGLIQFMPSTAIGYGTTTEKLKKMNEVQQLDYVEEFLVRTKKQRRLKPDEKITAGTLYAMVFLPIGVKKNVVSTKGDGYYDKAYNYKLDINGDGEITKAELGQRLYRFMA